MPGNHLCLHCQTRTAHDGMSSCKVIILSYAVLSSLGIPTFVTKSMVNIPQANLKIRFLQDIRYVTDLVQSL